MNEEEAQQRLAKISRLHMPVILRNKRVTSRNQAAFVADPYCESCYKQKFPCESALLSFDPIQMTNLLTESRHHISKLNNLAARWFASGKHTLPDGVWDAHDYNDADLDALFVLPEEVSA